MKLKPAYESLSYSPGSKLAKGLIQIFQEVKDFPLKQPPTDNFNKLWEETLSFFEMTSVPKFIKLIKEELGIVVGEVLCREFYKHGLTPNGLFFIYKVDKVKRKEDSWFNSLRDVIQGSEHRENLAIENAERLNKFIAALDQETGKFTFSKNAKESVMCSIGIDLAAIVYTDVILHKKIQPLSAEEVTSIIIHELGHLICELSYGKFTHYSIEVLRGAFQHFKTYASTAEKIKFIKTSPFTNKDLKGIITEDGIKKDIEDLTEKITKIPGLDGNDSVIGPLIGRVIDFIISVFFELIILPFTIWYYMISFKRSELILEAKNKNHTRMADFKCVGRQMIEAERIADEFTNIHGMGSYLMTALKKVDEMLSFSVGINKYKFPNYSRTNNLLFSVSNYLGAMSCCFGDTRDKAGLNHPVMAERINFLLQSQIKIIKENVSDPNLMKIAIEEYERMLEIANDKTLNMKMTKFSEMVFKAIRSLSGLISLGMVNMNQRAQIESILNAAEEIMHNDIFIISEKIKLKFN